MADVRTVLDMVAAGFAATAQDARRVACGPAAASTADLDAWAWGVAEQLRSRGIGPGDFVPVVLRRDPGLVAGWLGVLRAGAAYVPIEVDMPSARRQAILRDVEATVVLVDPDGTQAVRAAAVDAEPLALTTTRATPSALPRIAPGDPAVVVYPSGTTGQPKGVVVSHGNLLHSALAWSWLLDLTPADRLLCPVSTSFEPASVDVFGGLCSGARLVFADDEERRDPKALLQLCRGPDGVTVAALTPSMLREVLDADDGTPGTLRAVSCGGEVLVRQLAQDCVRRWGVTLHNLYGATECSGFTTAAVVDPADQGPPPLGRPVPNARVYLLGSSLEELPEGVPGEVYLAGPGVTLGYLRQPELLAQRFQPDPYAAEPSARMYRTGDLAVRRLDGELELVARADQQFKILGNRAELAEIQTPVSGLPAVARAADQPGKTALTAAQRPVAQLFAEVLVESGLGHAGQPPEALAPDADFFVLGGHSLLAVRMIAKATERFGRAVPLREFLREPTVAGLGRLLETTPAVEVPAAPDPQTWQPATPVQQRLWFLDRLPQLRSAYLVPVVLEYTGPVDPGRLRAAVQLVLGRHPALRSRFRLDRDRRAVVYRTDGAPPQVGYVDTGATGWDESQLRDHVAALCWEPFDLAAAPARAEVITVGELTLLMVAAHHIVLDGWSLQLLIAEIGEVYRAAAETRAPRLPEPVHPATVAAPAPEGRPGGLQEILAALQGAPLDIELPHDRPRPAVQPTRGATASRRLGPELTRQLRAIAAQHGCTTFVVLVTLLAVALARRGSQRDFVFCFPWAGRDAPGRTDAVGMFVNTLLVRVDLSSRPSWPELLEQVRAASVTSFRNADVSFDAVVAALQPDRDLSRPPITPVIVSLLDAPPDAPDLGPQLHGQLLPLEPLHVKYEFAVTAIEHPADLELSIDYPVDLFDHHTVTAVLASLRAGALDLVRRPEANVLDPLDTRDDPATAAAGEPRPAVGGTELVQWIQQTWQDVLAAGSVPLDVSFFDAGGNSLLLIMLLDELNTLTDQELTAADLFRCNTVLSQARLLSGADGGEQPTGRGATDRRRLLGVARRPYQKPVAS